MSIEKTCCNCIHCARWRTSKSMIYHCDLDDRYLGYATVMSKTDCKNWEKETKWDEQKKHDAEVRAKVIDECIEELKPMLSWTNTYVHTVTVRLCIGVLELLKKEQKE